MREKFTVLKVLFLLILLFQGGLHAQLRIGFQYGMQPVDAVNDSEGNYYLLTKYNVQIFNAQGEFVRKFSVPQTGQYEIGLSGIEVDETKTIFVVDGQNAKVFAFDADGVLKYSFGEFGSDSGKLYLPSDIELGPDGNIYLANSGRKAISIFTKAGVFLKEIGSEGTGNGQFSSIEHLAVSASGNVYGVDWYSSKIQAFDSQGNFLFSFGSKGTAQGQFKNYPKGITVDSNSGRIIVCESYSSRVNIFDDAGNYLSQFTSSAEYIHFNGSNLVVAEAPDRIRNISIDGTELSIIGGKSSVTGNFNGTAGLAYDSDGNLYVADDGNSRIQVFNVEGQLLRTFGSKGSNDGQFTAIGGLAIDKNNTLYVIDLDAIKIFTKEGAFIRKFGSTGSTNGKLSSPSDVAVDDDGNIYVADRNNRRMQVFSNDGTFIRVQAHVYEYMYSAGLDKQGNSYLGGGSTWISVFNPSGTLLGHLMNNGLGNSVMYTPSGIVVKENVIYIRDSRYVHKYDRNTRTFISRHGVRGDSPGEFTTGLEQKNHRIALNKDETMLAVSDGLCVQVFPLTNVIDFPSSSTKYVDDPDFELPTNSSAGLPVSYVTNDPTIASVTGNKVNINKAGTVFIIANQAGNALTPAAQQMVQELVISKKDQTIAFQLTAFAELKELSLSLTAGASSGLDVEFSVDEPSIARIENGKLLLLKEGVVKVTARQSGNENYNAATNVLRELTITKSDQIITFNALAGTTFGNAPFTVQATASSDLPVILSSGDPEVATVTGNIITIVGAGVATITATQPGNQYFKKASIVEQRLFVSKALQEITFADIPDQRMENSTFQLSATSTSGLPVTYIGSHSEVASISGNMVTFHKPGTIAIAANQTGNENYEAAIQVAKLLTILKKNQTITFDPLWDRIVGEEPFELTATSDSNLPITYVSSNENVATVEGNIVTLQGAGITTITAKQAGGEIFEAKESEQTLHVKLVTEAEGPHNYLISIYPNPSTDKITIVSKAKEDENVKLFDATGREVKVKVQKGEAGAYEIVISSLPIGVYTVCVQTQNTTRSFKFVKE